MLDAKQDGFLKARRLQTVFTVKASFMSVQTLGIKAVWFSWGTRQLPISIQHHGSHAQLRWCMS